MYKEKILKQLLSSKEFVSGAELAGHLRITRTAVWKHIKALERDGFAIEAVPSKGYRLSAKPDVLMIENIKRGLKTRIIGREIVLLPETVSTNTAAMDMAAHGAAEGTVVIAETQSGGRGRLGRTWISPKKNVYMSVVLRPDMPPHRAQIITLMGAVAVTSAIRDHTGLQAAIKWPNDILISDRKAAGLLTEMRAEQDRIKHVVLGIGLNVNMDMEALPAPVRKISTTLAAELGRKVERNLFVHHMLVELDGWYQAVLGNDAQIIEAWHTLNTTSGRRVAVSGNEALEGLAEGIDADGRLILRLDDGSVRLIAAGDVTIMKGSRGQ